MRAPNIIAALEGEGDYAKRRAAIAAFNAANTC